MTVLTISNLTIKHMEETIVQNIELSINEGDWLALVGESGSGKSVTASSIGGLLPCELIISSGSIRLCDVELININEKEMRNYRGKEISYIFQDYQGAFTPFMTIGAQFDEMLKTHTNDSKQQRKARSLESLKNRKSAGRWKFLYSSKIMDPSSFKKMMKVNMDLFIRTMCLLTVFNLFTAKGASFGTETLAANAILIQIHFIMAYFYDGFANASSIMTGKAIGLKDKTLYQQTLRLSWQWAVYSSVIIVSGYYLFSDYILRLFTNIPETIKLAQSYEIWIIIFPIAISFGIVLYGVFTGATEAAPIRDSMLLALSTFLIAYFLVVPLAGNHGLWLSFVIFSAGRSIFLAMFVPRLTRKLFPENESVKNNRNNPLKSSLL